MTRPTWKRRWTTNPATYRRGFTSGCQIEEEAEDIDEPSDKEEDIVTRWRKAPRVSQIKFPTKEEFQKGFI